MPGGGIGFLWETSTFRILRQSSDTVKGSVLSNGLTLNTLYNANLETQRRNTVTDLQLHSWPELSLEGRPDCTCIYRYGTFGSFLILSLRA